MASELLKAGGILKVGQRVEFYLDDDDNGYSSRIEDITKDRLIVAMPLDSRRMPVIPKPNATVYGNLSDGQSRFRFFTTFKGTGRYDGNIAVWFVVLPKTVERHQNREFVRVKVNLLMSVRQIDEEGEIGEPVKTRVVDLSGNGIAFVMKERLRAGSHVAIEVYNIPGFVTFDCMCRVIRCVQVSRKGEPPLFHVGAKFENISHTDTEKIVHYLFYVQRQGLIKGIN